ncbi:TRAP transporter substrate-binding protein [Luteimonas fraxinea]|uniref:TRAP transporter substrate-binding protein n=1 Tax=Luteimonas fraxinea TaxID=2901869 RepID=A0ABS8UIK5_9GAMM|nr:TRAP transporter substrate-binding protein [Luteimonas fraxinea]MCD9098546.1 TRAP transporter substrate-binding protein [Luteimonas fraxinea]MCD9127279.1 TRAP transporter substrate-binding protein [Luteimonas fraxinea]UHH09049.1 TRAP transporter substrate-binding protein [Luteimonas fraxinea]
MTTRRAFLAGLGAACAAPLIPSVSRADEANTVLTATDVHVADYPTVNAVKWIGETMDRETNGRVRLRQYHSGQLGRESEAIDMARFGAIDMTRVYAGALNNAFPLTTALCLPYAFDSVAHMRHALDSGVAQTVLDGFGTRDLVGMAVYDSGARCFYNTRHPIVTPKDLHGLKLRVASSDMFIDLVRLLGANPTPMSLGDTFSGMETHMIDGAENNMRSFHSSRHFEAAHYWSQSEHSYAPDILLISRRSLDALRPGDRDLLIDTARASVPVMRKMWDESEGAARQQVADYGIEFNDVDMDAFLTAAQPIRDRYLQQPELQALYRRIRDLA